MADDVINQLLLSRAIPGVSFNFIAYVEPEIPGGGCTPPPPPKKFLAYNKTQNSRFSFGNKFETLINFTFIFSMFKNFSGKKIHFLHSNFKKLG